MKYVATSKSELARAAGVSDKTFRMWLRRLAIPDYRPRQKIFTPAQTQYICEQLCITL